MPSLYSNTLINVALCEIFTNVHSFIVIVTNHFSNDVYKPVKAYTGELYLRQIISSVNFDDGTDTIDFFHGYLNYQIEHHLFPNMSMLSLRKAMPEVKKICKKHNI